jgi:hypothetical protein
MQLVTALSIVLQANLCFVLQLATTLGVWLIIFCAIVRYEEKVMAVFKWIKCGL